MSRLLFGLIFFVSCSNLGMKLEVLDFEKFKKIVRSNCFIEAGKGRISSGEKKYSFGYDTILAQNSQWSIILDIPFHAEEDLSFYRSVDGIRIGGSFYQRLISMANKENSHYSQVDITHFLNQMGSNVFMLLDFTNSSNDQLLDLWNKCQLDSKNQICSIRYQEHDLQISSQSIKVQMILDSSHHFEWLNLTLDGDFFAQKNLTLYNFQLNSKKVIFKLELLMSQCKKKFL